MADYYPFYDVKIFEFNVKIMIIPHGLFIYNYCFILLITAVTKTLDPLSSIMA